MQSPGSALGPASEISPIRPVYDLAGKPIADGDGGRCILRYRVYGPGIDSRWPTLARSTHPPTWSS